MRYISALLLILFFLSGCGNRGWIYLTGFAILVAIASFLFDTGNDEGSDEHNKETVKGDKE